MTIMDYSTLSYRELQTEAKKHSIPANKKKEELIRLLTALELSSQDTEAGVTAILDSMENEVVPEVVVEPAAAEPVKMAAKSKKASKKTPIETAPIAAAVVVEEAPVEEEQELTEVEELSEHLNDMKLKGIATPQGKKTVFELSSPDFKYLVNWG